MKFSLAGLLCAVFLNLIVYEVEALSPGDISVRMSSGYFWLDNACTPGGPQGKVVSFKVQNLKSSALNGLEFTLGSIGFNPGGTVSYTSGSPSFTCRTSSRVYLGNLAPGDTATIYFFVGYNCLIYPNNSNITTDTVSLPLQVEDQGSGTVSLNFRPLVYVIRNSSNNTITTTVSSSAVVGTVATLTVAYGISNVKPSNIIDLEISTLNTFPAGYEIIGSKIVSSSVGLDFPVGLRDVHYSDSISSNLPSGGSVTIEWYLKITGPVTGLNPGNLQPYVVADAGSAHRWQANASLFTGTATPVNTISMIKKVNNPTVLSGDTVVYTITLYNNSPQETVSVDRLVDDLPRDYTYRFSETDTNAYPGLVHASNATRMPLYNDSDLLEFWGHKEMSPGNYSWMIPPGDSITVRYSVRVSDLAGVNDSNLVTAYIGNYKVADAFAVVDVLSFLPLRLLYFEPVQKGPGLTIQWALEGLSAGSRFELKRQNPYSGIFEPIAEIESQEGKTAYEATDFTDDFAQFSSRTYHLYCISPDQETVLYSMECSMPASPEAFSVRAEQGKLYVYASQPMPGLLQIGLCDLQGRMLLQEQSSMSDGVCTLSYPGEAGPRLAVLRIEWSGQVYTAKILLD